MARRFAWLLAVLLVAAGCSGSGDGVDRSGTLTLVSLNVLHGLICPPETDGCQLPDRVALTMRLVEERGCPEVVALQEVSTRILSAVRRLVPRTCGGRYREVWVPDRSIDRELVLTTLTSTAKERRTLAGGMRTVLWTRLEGVLGDVDLLVTHLGANGNSDGTGGGLCTPQTCHPPCRATMTLHQCQLVQLGAMLDEKRGDDRIGVVAGDFNLVPTAPPLVDFVRRRHLIDTYVAAGRPECDPASGEGCTGGRDDASVTELQDPAINENERIDYAFVATTEDCTPRYGTGTRLFADEPVTDGPGGLAWPSDHIGVAVELSCR